MKNAQATRRDLALKLNTSISTDSRALRGRQDLKPETKKAILDMAKKLRWEELAKRFIDQVENPGSFKPITKVLHTEFIIRNSTRKMPEAMQRAKV